MRKDKDSSWEGILLLRKKREAGEFIGSCNRTSEYWYRSSHLGNNGDKEIGCSQDSHYLSLVS